MVEPKLGHQRVGQGAPDTGGFGLIPGDSGTGIAEVPNRRERVPPGRLARRVRRDVAHAPHLEEGRAKHRTMPAHTTAVPADLGYTVVSALALAVEAVEALSTFLSDCDPGLTAAVRPFERAAL